ncbi:thiol reductant ABC exporter subunit CydD [Actinopolymorpha sp. B11F2]|uniref:thiol reductant ABC exporter subunit CydD n=1 Tax=Actinopolymorpha sp. B11F2 TaxID=3160862 RepID=UPI0032E45E42
MRPLDPRLLRQARATGLYVGFCVALGAAAAGLVIAQASLLADGIADGSPVLVPLGAVVVARAVLMWLQEVAAGRASAAVKSTLRQRLLAHALALGPSWLAGERKAALTTLATTGLDALDGYFARYLPQLVLAVIVPVSLVAYMFGVDAIAAVTVGATLPLIPVFMALVGLATQSRTRRRWRALAVLAHHFADTVAGLATLKAFGRARQQAQLLRRSSERHRTESLATLRIAFLSSLVLELLSTLSLALVAVGVGLRLVDGHLDLHTAVLVLVLAPEAYLPLRQVGTHFHASADGLAAADEVFRVLETRGASDGRGRRLSTMGDLGKASLTVADLEVRYPDRAEPAVSGLSFTLRPGELLALRGPSGAGKSTVVGVLLGFVAPTAGQVRLGPVDLAELDIDDWRAGLAWVPQRPCLQAGTVGSNVRLGAPEATDAQVGTALSAAGAAALDPERPVGERGYGLSAGQVRRVALARAFLRAQARRAAGCPCLLLLDEPTAGIDLVTEQRIARTLRDSGHTTLLVTHRPALLTLADRVVEVPLHKAPTSRPGLVAPDPMYTVS